jgi:8-oxo-dGTP pyrophosphatase MutT (NUDIX family)
VSASPSSAPKTSVPRHDFSVVDSDDIYTGKVLAVRRDQVRMPGGGTAVREIMEHAGAVAIAALDVDDRLVFIYQYRHAVGRRLWEMPAGLLDAAGEDPVETARRELAEEVGLSADEWSVLIDVDPSPGFSDESVRVYLATGLHEVGRPDLGADDEEADLEIHRIALADAVAMVFAGEIVNSSCAAGVLAVHAVRTGAGRTRPADSPWPDRPTRFAARKA